MSRLTERRGDITPRRRSVDVCLDGHLEGKLNDLAAELLRATREDAKSNEPDRAPAIAREIERLEEQAQERTVTIVLEACGDSRWRELKDAHPPTKEQRAKSARDKTPLRDHDPDTFVFAGLAECIVEVDGEPDTSTPEEVKLFCLGDDDGIGISKGAVERLSTTLFIVNEGETSVPFNWHASAMLRGDVESSSSAES